MIGNNIWPDEARSLMLHLIPQSTYHWPAQIRGSQDALRRLGTALIEAADSGSQDMREVEMMAADGEGYSVEIYPMSDQQMAASPLPYAQLGQSWDFDRCFDCPHDHPTPED